MLWGGNPVAVRYTVDTLPPVAVAALRFALAAGFMAAWCLAAGAPLWLDRAQRRLAFIGGVMLFAQIALLNWGMVWSSASHGAVLINACVFVVAGLEHFVLRTERYSARRLFGLTLAASGVLIVVAATGMGESPSQTADQATLTGDLLLLASAVLLGIKIVYTKHAVRRMDPGTFILWHEVVGVVLFALYSLSFESPRWAAMGTAAVWGLLYQGLVVGGFCFAVQTALLKRYSAAKVTVFNCATPICGIVLSNLFRGDALSGWILAAGVTVACGVYLVTAPTPLPRLIR